MKTIINKEQDVLRKVMGRPGRRLVRETKGNLKNISRSTETRFWDGVQSPDLNPVQGLWADWKTAVHRRRPGQGVQMVIRRISGSTRFLFIVRNPSYEFQFQNKSIQNRVETVDSHRLSLLTINRKTADII